MTNDERKREIEKPANISVRESNDFDAAAERIDNAECVQRDIADVCQGRAVDNGNEEEPSTEYAGRMMDFGQPKQFWSKAEVRSLMAEARGRAGVTGAELDTEVEKINDSLDVLTKTVATCINGNVDKMAAKQADYEARFETLRHHLADQVSRINALESAAGTKPVADLSCRGDDEHQEANEARSGGPDADDDEHTSMMAIMWGIEDGEPGQPVAFNSAGSKVLPIFTDHNKVTEFLASSDNVGAKPLGLRPQDIGRVILKSQSVVDCFAINPVGPAPGEFEKESAAELIWSLIYEAHGQGHRRAQRKVAAE